MIYYFVIYLLWFVCGIYGWKLKLIAFSHEQYLEIKRNNYTTPIIVPLSVLKMISDAFDNDDHNS